MGKTRNSKRRAKSSRPGQPGRVVLPGRSGAANALAVAERKISKGDFQGAAKLLKQVVEERPQHKDAIRLLAQCWGDLDRHADAVTCWERLCELQPDDAQTLHLKGQSLQSAFRVDEARRAFLDALALDPAHAGSLACLFDQDERAHRFDEAAQWLERLEAAHPDLPCTLLARARLAQRQGNSDQALAILENPPEVETEIELYGAWQNLRGKLLDEAGRYDEAFDMFRASNRGFLSDAPSVEQRKSRYIASAQDIPRILSEEDYSRWAHALPPSGYQIVWQVGFPRSGTTLLDQVLDAHPNVTVLSETDALGPVLALLNELPGGYPACLATMDDELASKLRKVYLAKLATLIGPLQPGQVYVDKMPIHTMHRALAARLIPEAKVIFCARDPADACLSCFMQHFRLNDAMTCFLTLEDTVALYNAIMDCDEHFDRVLEQNKITVRYEDLVDDLETQVRQVISFLGLSWDDSVLAWQQHALARDIRTPSYEQVVRPIYGSAVHRWHHYREQLSPWLEKLRHHAERLGYAVDDYREVAATAAACQQAS